MIFTIITALVINLLLCVAVSASFSQPELKLDDLTVSFNGYTESAKEGKGITVTVYNPGNIVGLSENEESNSLKVAEFAENLTAEQAQTVINNIRTYKTDKDGCVNVSFKLHKDTLSSGDVVIAIGGDDFEQLVVKTVYYASETDRQARIELINAATEDELKNTYIENSAKMFGYDNFEAYKQVDKGALAKLLFAHLTEKDATVNDFQKTVKTLSLICAFNASAKSLCATEDFSDFLHKDILMLDVFDNTYNSTIVEFYENSMNAEGKKNVVLEMFGKDIDSLSKWHNQFKKQVIIHGLKNSVNSGRAQIAKLLTAVNTKDTGIDASLYLALNSTQKANAEIFIVQSQFTTAEELNTVILAAVEASKTTTPSGGGGGGGIGGGGSSPSVMPGVSTGGTVTIPNELVKNETSNVVFTDLTDVKWAEQYILDLNSKVIVSRLGNGKFAPNDYVTREQMAKMLCIAFDITEVDNEKYFDDVDNSEWYSEYVMKAASAGIVKGVTDATFGTGQFISRQDAAVMICRALNVDNQKSDTKFADKNEIAEYAVEYVAFLNAEGIISGFDDNTFRPDECCTRAQMAKILSMAIQFAEQKGEL